MKKTLLLAVGMVAAIAGHAQQATIGTGVTAGARRFSVQSSMPGLPEGAKAYIMPSGTSDTIVVGKVQGGQLRLGGSVPSPMLAELHIDTAAYPLPEGEYMKDRLVVFYLDGADYRVEAAAFDSIPLSYQLGSSPVLRENNYRVTGGEAQRQYQQWHDAVWASRLKAEQASQRAWRYKYGGDVYGGPAHPDAAEARRLDGMADSLHAVYQRQSDAYAWAHPAEPYSLWLQSRHLREKFRYTASELDSMAAHYRGNTDTAGYADLVKDIDAARPYVRGQAFKDVTLRTTDGKAVRLSALVKKGQYTLLDFWASWCGPCRASIPAMKQLHKDKPQLNIVSISCDKNLNDWARAMKEEQMPWTQVVLPQDKALNRQVVEAFDIQYIPSLVLIAPDGTIAGAASAISMLNVE